MPLPTVNVTVTILEQDNQPVAGAIITARLTKHEEYQGTIVPDFQEFRTDALGQATMPLWPNTLGVTGSQYHVQARHPVSGKRLIDAKVTVPNIDPSALYELINNPVATSGVAGWAEVERSKFYADLAEEDRAAAAAILHDFRTRYQGAHTTEPTTRYDGSALQQGDLYYDASSAVQDLRALKVWDTTLNAGAGGWRGGLRAAAVPITDTAGHFTATDVEAALAEEAQARKDHAARTDNPHAVAAAQVSIADAGANFVATTVEGALAEEADARQAHEARADNPHAVAASQVPIADVGVNFAATTVEDALAEEADARQAHEARTDNPHAVKAAQVAIDDTGANFTATTVEAALAEEADARQAHEARTDNPHAVAAGQVGIADAGGHFVATTVEDALAEEAQARKDGNNANDSFAVAMAIALG